MMSMTMHRKPYRLNPSLCVCGVLILFGMLFALGYNLPHPGHNKVHTPPMSKALDKPYVTLSDHCRASHPEECEKVTDWINKHGRWCGYGCNDGRDRFMCHVSKDVWYVLVGVADEVITAYATDYKPISVTNGCTSHYQGGHP